MKKVNDLISQILVPVDFSDSSRDAFFHGIKMATKLQARIIVINVFTPVVIPAEGMLYADPSLQNATKDRFANFVADLRQGLTTPDQQAIEIDTQFRIGMITHQLQSVIREMPGSMVVMGTSGTGIRAKELLGSVSLWMVKHAECPVLLVPPTKKNNKFSASSKILFASDHLGMNQQVLSAIKYYSGSPEAQIHIVHVVDEGSKLSKSEVKVLYEDTKEHVKELIIFNPQFLESVQTYTRANEIDMIVMERKERGFWKELFHASQTKKMALHSEVPLLVLHDREIKLFA